MSDVNEQIAVAVHETTRRLQKVRGDKQVDPAWKRVSDEKRDQVRASVDGLLDGDEPGNTQEGRLASELVRRFADAAAAADRYLDPNPDPTIIGPDSDANVLETAEGTFDQADVDG